MNNIKQEGKIIKDTKDFILESNSSYIISDELLKKDIIFNIDNIDVKFYLYTKKNKINIKFIQKSNSNLQFICAFDNDNDLLDINIVNDIVGNNNHTYIKCHVFNNINGNSIVNVTGSILKNTYNNIYTEDIKGINPFNNKLEIIPNLLVSSKEVLANHLVSISNFNNDDMYYLNQKGISHENASKLLTSSFLTGLFPDDIKLIFKNNGGE